MFLSSLISADCAVILRTLLVQMMRAMVPSLWSVHKDGSTYSRRSSRDFPLLYLWMFLCLWLIKVTLYRIEVCYYSALLVCWTCSIIAFFITLIVEWHIYHKGITGSQSFFFSHFLLFILANPDVILGTPGVRQGYALNGTPVCYRAPCTDTFIHI